MAKEDIEKVRTALKKLSSPENIAEVVQDLGGINNLATLELVKELLAGPLKDSEIVNLYNTAPSSGGKTVFEPLLQQAEIAAKSLAIDTENAQSVLQLTALLQGLEARGKENAKNATSYLARAAEAGKDVPVRVVTGYTRLELAEFIGGIGRKLEERLKAPVEEKKQSPEEKVTVIPAEIADSTISTETVAPASHPISNSSSSSQTGIMRLLNSLGTQEDKHVDFTATFLEADNLEATFKEISDFFKENQEVAKLPSIEEIEADDDAPETLAHFIQQLDAFIKAMHVFKLGLTEFSTQIEAQVKVFQEKLESCERFDEALDAALAGNGISKEVIDNIISSLKLEPAEAKELETLQADYEQGKTGSYFSFQAWRAWAQLGTTEKILVDKLKEHIGMQRKALSKNIDSYKNAVTRCKDLISEASGLTQNATNLQQQMQQKKEALHGRVKKDVNGQAKEGSSERIGALEEKLRAHIRKLNKRLAKFIAFITGKWEMHCTRLKEARSLLSQLTSTENSQYAAPDGSPAVKSNIEKLTIFEEQAAELGISLPKPSESKPPEDNQEQPPFGK